MRTIIIGGPMSGKSTYASKLGVPHYCTDPKSLSREVLPNATYLPEGLGWSEGSEFIEREWFTNPGPWVIEGVAVVRALRKFIKNNPGLSPSDQPCEEIIFMHGGKTTSQGQDSMIKSINTIWDEISGNFVNITRHIYRD